ncbi:MAG TPA: HD domain-containing protein [Longimicrobiales bacterium]
MSAADLIEAAAAGELPAWAEAGPRRRAHMARVARLMDAWACRLGLDEAERVRWRAAAWLHDALRDADPERLRAALGSARPEWPAGLLHGPATAARLEAEGVRDEALVRAVAWHTIGHPDMDRLGHALYIADYIEPGRAYEPERLAVLRARMPAALDAVLREVAERRIAHLVHSRRALAPESVAFWNRLTGA